ncbi:MAG: hypothetical protein GY839_04880 [candidate division Zixibacteria bacterium]|nr:hypothetical protein [candidate division Zixibacteria bacterium]
MANEPKFDTAAAHKYFSAQCFNQTWGLIDKTDRTDKENEQMIQLSQASIYHWTQREDCTDNNMSIGYWMASRVYALLGMADNARRYGQLSLDCTQESESFTRGYAFEALARAEMVAGNDDKKDEYLAQARKYADSIEKDDEKKYLVDDLATIR